jgi:hypothetical protein
MDAVVTRNAHGDIVIKEFDVVVHFGTFDECAALVAEAARKGITVKDLLRGRKCRWLVHGTPRWVLEAYASDETGEFEWYPEEPGDLVSECGADVTDHDNGWSCAAGHSHFHDVEYFDDDEVTGMRAAHLPFPTNAARMDGSPL